MSKELIEQVKEYVKDVENRDLLYNAIFNELFYQYTNICIDYTDFDDVNLTVEDFENMTSDVMSTYYMNEGLTQLLTERLYDYVKGLDKNV